MSKNHIYHNSKTRDGYFWNMIGSLLLAFQSVIMSIIIARLCGLEAAGIFTISYANANLFFTIGKYGMRYFQASDPDEKFLFVDYLSSRIITSLLMIVSSLIYIFILAKTNNYSNEKTEIMILICLFKVIDVIEDVFYGRYQQLGHMDIAAKALSFRVFASTFIWVIVIILTKNISLSTIIAIILSIILLFIILFYTKDLYPKNKYEFDYKRTLLLLKTCFPLFWGSFLALYISNAPKYSIDALLSDDLQACYGIISMPVLAISLVNGIIFNPIINKMSLFWTQGKLNQFIKTIIKQFTIVIAFSTFCIVCSYILGIPILSFIYDTDLSQYQSELITLLIGGGFYGISSLLNTIITIIRFQKSVLIGYTLVAILALLFSSPIVRQYGIIGATWLYTILMGILCLYFIVSILFGLRKHTTKYEHF